MPCTFRGKSKIRNVLIGLVGLSFLLCFGTNINTLSQITAINDYYGTDLQSNFGYDAFSVPIISKKNNTISTSTTDINIVKFRNSKFVHDQPLLLSSPQVQQLMKEDERNSQLPNNNNITNDQMTSSSSSLKQSIQHQSRFDQRKNTLAMDFPLFKLFIPPIVERQKFNNTNGGDKRITNDGNENDIWNEGYVALPILKNEKSFITQQTTLTKNLIDDDTKGFQKESIATTTNRPWVILVRDPIDHFLLGWAECERRYNQYRIGRSKRRQDDDNTNNNDYHTSTITNDQQIPAPINWNTGTVKRMRQYLKRIRTFIFERKVIPTWACEVYSFPQGNFILSSPSGTNGEQRKEQQQQQQQIIHGQIQYVGDWNEMNAVMKFANYSSTIVSKKQTATTTIPTEERWYTKEYFFTDIQTYKELEIPNDIMIEICMYVAIDYYLFSFVPPIACQGTVFHPDGTMLPHIVEEERKLIIASQKGPQPTPTTGGPPPPGLGPGPGPRKGRKPPPARPERASLGLYAGRNNGRRPPPQMNVEQSSTLEERAAILNQIKDGRRKQGFDPVREEEQNSDYPPMEEDNGAEEQVEEDIFEIEGGNSTEEVIGSDVASSPTLWPRRVGNRIINS